MQKKNLEKQLKLEAEKFVPNKIDTIYSKLGINVLSNSSNKDIEIKLEAEGSKLVKNNIDNIYKKLGIEQKNESNSYIEDRIKSEKSLFVPVVLNDVYDSINHKNPHNKFYFFIHDKTNITIVSSLILVGIVSGVIIPNIIQNNNNVEDNSNNITNDDSSSNIAIITPSSESGVTIDVASPSNTYRAKASFFVTTNGTIDSSKIITTDDQSAYVIDNIDKAEDTSASIKYSIGNNETIFTFTSKYLISALNCGIFEKQNISRTNTIKFFIETRNDNGTYYNAIKNDISNEIKTFMKNYKVVASIEVSKSEEDEALSTIEDEHLADLISEAYNLASRVFIFSDGTALEDAYFSSDLKDWVEVFKDYQIREMEEIVEFLWFINDHISTQEEIDQVLTTFKNETKSIKEEVKQLNSYLDKIVSVRENIFASLKEGGNDLREKYSTYKDLICYLLNNNKIDIKEDSKWDFENYKPNDEIKEWKWWKNGLNHFEPHDDIRSFTKGVENNENMPPEFVDSLSKYDETSTIELNERSLLQALYDQYELEHFRDMAINIIDSVFKDIFTKIENDDYHHGHRDDEDYNHYHPEPDGWDEQFDDWWDHHWGEH